MDQGAATCFTIVVDSHDALNQLILGSWQLHLHEAKAGRLDRLREAIENGPTEWAPGSIASKGPK